MLYSYEQPHTCIKPVAVIKTKYVSGEDKQGIESEGAGVQI